MNIMSFLRRWFVVFSLFFIMLLACVLFLYRLDSSPVGSLVDEPAFGYNAYAIGIDGKDEHGVYFPLIFESYGDQKMPAYVYTLVPFVYVFGLSNFAVRLPSVLAIVALIPVVYLFLREFSLSRFSAVISSALFAFSPFAFMMSRFGRESSFGLFFFTLGLVALFRFLKTSKIVYIFLFVFSFLIAWYSYVAYRFVIILIFPVIVVFSWYVQRVGWRQLILLVFLFFLGILPSLFYGSVVTARFYQVGIFNEQGPRMEIQEKAGYCGAYTSLQLCRVIANKPVVFFRRLFSFFIEAFSPQYLFLYGDSNLFVQNVEHYGQYYLFTVFFFFLGVFAYFSHRTLGYSSVWWLFLFILPLCVIPAVVAGLGQKMRSAPFILLCIVFIGLGVHYLTLLLSRYFMRYVYLFVFFLISIMLVVETFMFQLQFHTVHVAKFSVLYNSHLPSLMRFIKQYEGKLPVRITSFTSDPLMYYAFYTRVPIDSYRSAMQFFSRDGGGFRHAKSYKNIEVVPAAHLHDVITKTSLPFIYVTDTPLVSLKPIYTGFSDNQVHALVYVYEITDYSQLF